MSLRNTTLSVLLATALGLSAGALPASDAIQDFLLLVPPGVAVQPAEPATVPTAASPASPAPPAVLTSEQTALVAKVKTVLDLYAPRHLNTRDHSAWEVMHGIIAYGTETKLFRGGPGGETVNAVSWTCFNGECRGDKMLYLSNGKIAARRGPGVQGHDGQFLAILAQSRVKIDYPMNVDGKSFTIADLIEYEKQTCMAGEELTFKLISLMHYLDSDAEWTNRHGEKWTIQRLVKEEIKQPIRGAACGGTHRLMGLSYSVNKRIKRGKEIVGEFTRAQKYINEYHRYTHSLQNPDGSFSTEWFTRKAASPDVDRRLKTSGHILEWLAFSLSDEEIRQPWVTKAVDYLSGILLEGKNRTWEIGPLGHGLHGLALYHERMTEIATPAPPIVAEQQSSRR